MLNRSGVTWRSARAAIMGSVWIVALLAAGPRAAADDVGQVAVIEDTSGKILPASGLCSNFLYPNGLCVPLGGVAFYATHPDAYDILVFLTNKNLPASEKAGYPLKADVHGIGQDTTPWSYAHFGSQGRLMQAVDLGSVQSLPDDPEGIFTGSIPISGLEVVGHEIGHHFMAYASVNLDDGGGNRDIIRGHLDSGTITHWSCWLNSDSVMYGGMLTDHGDGTFTDVNGPRKYSQLDQYLMGLRQPDASARQWDSLARVPYLSFGSAQPPDGCTYISYDDDQSVAEKGAYLKAHGLGGVIEWEINEGYIASAPAGERSPLLSAVRDHVLH